MKKSELKRLIREMVQQLTETPEVKISQLDRKKISNQMHKFPVLGGNAKVSNPSEALKFIQQALSNSGFQLDMVTGDILLGDKGRRLLPFSRIPTNPSSDGDPVGNSRIAFNWEVTSVSPTNSLDKKFEIIAYVT